MLKTNMGGADRIIRLVAAIVLIVAFFTIPLGAWGWLALALAAIFLVTSLVSSCPLYTIFGISTCPMKKS